MKATDLVVSAARSSDGYIVSELHQPGLENEIHLRIIITVSAIFLILSCASTITVESNRDPQFSGPIKRILIFVEKDVVYIMLPREERQNQLLIGGLLRIALISPTTNQAVWRPNLRVVTPEWNSHRLDDRKRRFVCPL